MNNIFTKWRSLPSEHKDYVFIYVWGFLWAVSYLIFTPTTTFTLVTQTIIWLWTITAMIGSGLALTGLLNGNNLLVERLGVTLLLIAPLAFALTQLSLVLYALIDSHEAPFDPTQRMHLIFLGFWPFLFLNKRRRQLKNRVLIARATPLASEFREGQ